MFVSDLINTIKAEILPKSSELLLIGGLFAGGDSKEIYIPPLDSYILTILYN
jgi:hypothetical protein